MLIHNVHDSSVLACSVCIVQDRNDYIWDSIMYIIAVLLYTWLQWMGLQYCIVHYLRVHNCSVHEIDMLTLFL